MTFDTDLVFGISLTPSQLFYTYILFQIVFVKFFSIISLVIIDCEAVF